MADLRIPKLNANDTEYLLVEWLVPDGAEVHEDDAIVLLETSKAAEELTADTSGTLHHKTPSGTWCHPNQTIAHITPLTTAAAAADDAADAADDTADVLSVSLPAAASAGRGTAETGVINGAQPPITPLAQPLITAPAQAMIDELGITPAQLATLNLPVIKRSDLAPLLPSPRRHQLSKVQRAVARSVQLSHQTIPAAYTVVRMNLAPALAHAATMTRQIRRPVAQAELFVQALAGLHDRFPLFFATIDGSTALLPDTPNIGVTVDMGEGLYVPVLHDAASLDLRTIATTLMKHRLSATTGDFRERDLTGANFVLTLHTEGDVVLAIPFVFPGTACALAVTAPHDGAFAHIGLAYDHRLINGREAALFLNALKAAIEGLT